MAEQNNSNSTNIKITGSRDVKLGDINTTMNLNQDADRDLDAVAKAFVTVLRSVEALPNGETKDEAAMAVQKLKAEAEKGEKAEEGNVRRWLTFLIATAPDVAEVAITTFINPILGIAAVFKKVAEQAKDELKSK